MNTDIRQTFEAFAAAADEARGAPDSDALSDDDIARALTAAVRLYAARVEATDKAPPPVTNDASATDVLVAASEMMRALNINGFDLMMWHDCSRRR